jgi:chromosome partitioning protein
MPVVAVANQKGGVGKTTTAVNLSAYLALSVRVLLIDLDPQANATSSLGLEPPARSTYDVLIGDARLPEVILRDTRPNLDLAPANRALAGAQVELVELPDRERRLRSAVDEVRADYDLVVIDCPPSLGILTLNALVAADLVLAPVQCEYLAL